MNEGMRVDAVGQFQYLRKGCLYPKTPSSKRVNEIVNHFHHIWYLDQTKELSEPTVEAPSYWLHIGTFRYAGEL